MAYSDEEVSRQLRLGEDSSWEFKAIDFADDRPKVQDPMTGQTKSPLSPMRRAAYSCAASPTMVTFKACPASKWMRWSD